MAAVNIDSLDVLIDSIRVLIDSTSDTPVADVRNLNQAGGGVATRTSLKSSSSQLRTRTSGGRP